MKCLKTVCIVCFFISACSGKKIPDDVLPIDTMKTVMWDMIMAGEYVNYMKAKDSSHIFDSTGYYTQTLQLHKLTREQFFKSYDFYEQHSTLNQELLDSISNYSNRQRSDLYEDLYGKKTSPKLNDSIKKRIQIRDSLLKKTLSKKPVL